jgi:hypothetical protein
MSDAGEQARADWEMLVDARLMILESAIMVLAAGSAPEIRQALIDHIRRIPEQLPGGFAPHDRAIFTGACKTMAENLELVLSGGKDA